MLFLLLLVLGIIQVAWTLYARNVTMSSAHEAARAALEYGAGPDDGRIVAERVVRQAAGGLLENLNVTTRTVEVGMTKRVRVVVSAQLRALGPIPFKPRMVAFGTASTLSSVP